MAIVKMSKFNLIAFESQKSKLLKNLQKFREVSFIDIDLEENVNTDEERVLPTNAVFVAVGIEPMTKIYEGLVKLNDAGYIVTDNRCKTNIDGIYACGDVRDTPLRQVITAAADGAVAVSAMS